MKFQNSTSPWGFIHPSYPIDEWWADVLATHNFPHLGRVVKAALSIFTGPRVEQSFSVIKILLTVHQIECLLIHFQQFKPLDLICLLQSRNLLVSQKKSTFTYQAKTMHQNEMFF